MAASPYNPEEDPNNATLVWLSLWRGGHKRWTRRGGKCLRFPKSLAFDGPVNPNSAAGTREFRKEMERGWGEGCPGVLRDLTVVKGTWDSWEDMPGQNASWEGAHAQNDRSAPNSQHSLVESTERLTALPAKKSFWPSQESSTQFPPPARTWSLREVLFPPSQTFLPSWVPSSIPKKLKIYFRTGLVER